MRRWSNGAVAPSPPGPREASLSPAREGNIIVTRRDTLLDALPSDWQLPENDIDRCLSFSRVRCVLSLFSLCLLVTDIPRTGLGVTDVFQLFPKKVGPSMAMYFGPWAYPIAHIWQNSSTLGFEGKKGSSTIKTTTVWSYEYDSTSVGLRGITQLLNLSRMYPDVYQGANDRATNQQTATLALKTTFNELDTLATAVQHHLSARTRDDSHAQHQGYFAFATLHNWVDRLHHYLYRFTKANIRWRLHTIHAYAKETTDPLESLNICSAVRRRRLPFFCEMPVGWECTHPVNASLPKVAIWDHVDLRVASLQTKYPELALELTIFTTYNPTTSTFSAFFESEVLEIVMLTRGRNCSSGVNGTSASNTSASANLLVSPSTACKTVFVDDYRYERGVLESTIGEWYPVTATLRAVAQFYVWVRLVLLFCVAYTASGADSNSSNKQQRDGMSTRILRTLRTMSKIPFQVVVYGSLFPVLAYVIAQVLDCSFVDLFLESYWTTVNGTTSFDLLTFARHASIQMRNVWVLALVMKVVVYIQTRVMLWQPHDAIQGVRGLAISLSSMLSVFGPYRSLSFRNSAIITVFGLSGNLSDRGARSIEQVQNRPVSLFNVSMEGMQKDMKMTLLAVCAVFAIALVAKLLLTLLRPGYLGGILFNSSTIVPYSAGILWPTTALSVCFQVSLATSFPVNNNPLGLSRIAPVTIASGSADASTSSAPKGLTQQAQHHHLYPLVRLVWINATSACCAMLGIDPQAERMFAHGRSILHDHALRFEERSVEINSIVRLMNIAMMTDPWTLFRLRVLGAEVYFYESASLIRQRRQEDRALLRRSGNINTITGEPHHIFLLPYSPDKMLERTGYGKDEYCLVGHMSSRDLPWSVLLQCG
ncbi:hypothetical protein Gpo141_00012054 [Globisporangium polare]